MDSGGDSERQKEIRKVGEIAKVKPRWNGAVSELADDLLSTTGDVCDAREKAS